MIACEFNVNRSADMFHYFNIASQNDMSLNLNCNRKLKNTCLLRFEGLPFRTLQLPHPHSRKREEGIERREDETSEI
jgi:hypothetical protein